jgi:hypothetical protein
LSQVEAEMFVLLRRDDNGSFEEPRAALGAILQESYDISMVVLEQLTCPKRNMEL